MVSDGRGPDRGWQEDGSEGGSSSRSNDVPANLPNHPNDPSLTGSSSHGPRPQGSGPMHHFYVQGPSLVSRNQNGYYLDPLSGLTSSTQLPRDFQADSTQTWPNNQVIDAWSSISVTTSYPSVQYTIGDTPVGSTRHDIDRSSPCYTMELLNNTTVQPATHQQDVIQYSRDRRPSFPQVHAPIPHQPTDYASLPSPPRSNSSYSQTGPSPQRVRQHMPVPVVPRWDPPLGRSSRSTSNSTPGTYPHGNENSLSPVYTSDVVPSGNLSQASYFTSLTQPPSYSGETSSYPPYLPNNDPGDGPSFPVPQPAPPPAPAKRKRVTEDHPDPQFDRQTRRKVSRSDEPPVASGSSLTLDMLPRTARRRQDDKLRTEAHEKDAKRKKVERADLGYWFKRIASLLPRSDLKATRLQLLTRVIECLGGTPPETVKHPEKPNTKKGRSPKSHANAVRTNNENRAYNRVVELLRDRGFNVISTTAHHNLLRIVVHILSEKNGVVDEELTGLIISKFLNPQGYGTL